MALILACAPTPTAELAPDGKPVFKGPRVAMAVHQSCEFTTIRWAGPAVECLGSRTKASGLESCQLVSLDADTHGARRLPAAVRRWQCAHPPLCDPPCLT